MIEALSDAVGDRMRKTGRITVIFFEGTASSRVMQEARAMAIAARLPVLLVENLSTKRQRDASKKKGTWTALEYPSIPVDAQDVIAMYRVAHESIERARDGGGPTHIVSVRWQVAGSAGKRAGKAAAQDAVQHLEEWLTARGLPAREWRRAMVAEFEKGARKSELAFDGRNASDREAEDEGAEARAIA